MYKLYIADDEAYVIEGLLKCISWEKHDIAIVGTANDGATAYHEILSLQPDIVITDIKMPLMDGITLINEIHRQMPDVGFIIFSGYGDFYYAREALLANAIDFLVKPSSTEEILHAVSLAIKKHDKELQSINHDSPEYRKLIKNIFLNPVVEVYSEGYYYVAIFDTPELSNIHTAKKEVSVTISDNPYHISFINLFDRHLAVIYSQTLIEEISWPHLLDELRSNLEIFHAASSSSLFIGISQENKLHMLKQGFEEANASLEYCRWFSEPSCLFQNLQYHDVSTDQLSIWENLKKLLSKNNLDAVSNLLKEQFAVFAEKKISPASLKEFCIQNYLLLNNNVIQSSQINPVLEISSLSSIADSYTYTVNMYRNYFESLQQSDTNTDTYSKFIQKILNYVWQHYNEPISLIDISSYMRRSTNYISTKFKKEVGVNFTQYVTDYRLLKAKELLMSSNLKIKEIALHVGFTDEQYFSIVFKKECGITPGMYRKIYQQPS